MVAVDNLGDSSAKACCPGDACACFAQVVTSSSSSVPSLQSAMHEAYDAVPVVEKLPRQIESIACYSDNLLVGTKEGQLLVYTVRKNDVRFETTIERSNKLFSKKPITQLEVIPEYHILVSLSDGVVSVHDLTVFAPILVMEKARGATLFALDLQKQMTENGDVQYSLRMCVSVKRRLQLYYWKNRDFHELQPDLLTPDVTKAIVWCNNSLCVGFKREYFLIKIETGLLKELFPTGRQMEPLILKLSDNRLALMKDEATIFIDSDGNPTQKAALSWSLLPSAMVYSAPYVIAILPTCIEVRTIEPRLLIQSIELAKPKLICCGSQQQIYAASINGIWRLSSTAFLAQIKQLLAKKEFELALYLANMTEESTNEREHRLIFIRNLFAFDLFCQRRFNESFKIFAELGTDPSHVVGLFPNLLPDDFRSQLEYPDRIPELEGIEMERGLLSLIEYLTQKRNEILKDANKELVTIAIVEGATVLTSRKQLSQIIDTTLLKCYIQTNDALVAPLLRLKDNSCHVEEAERILKQHQKFNEMIILYEKKGLHSKALDLLLRQSQKPNSALSGHEPTLDYLQRLGPDHVDLIFDYAGWVMKACPDDGLRIFTDDVDEVKSLPRMEVLRYLERTESGLVIPYLEYIINEWSEEKPEFHDILALHYMDHVVLLMSDMIHSLPSSSTDECDEERNVSHELNRLRRKLNNFLKTSDYYTADRLLQQFPSDSLFEERAILLGKLGQHEQALAIYVHLLHDYDAAENYCQLNYRPDNEDSSKVFLYLLKLYLSKPDYSWMGINEPFNGSSEQPDLQAAIELLEKHSSHFDIVRALNLLPPSTDLHDILKFLENSLIRSSVEKSESHLMKNLLYCQYLQVLEKNISYRFLKCIITDQKHCYICKKRIGNSAFARYPNEVIVHYYCCKDVSSLSPTE